MRFTTMPSFWGRSCSAGAPPERLTLGNTKEARDSASNSAEAPSGPPRGHHDAHVAAGVSRRRTAASGLRARARRSSPSGRDLPSAESILDLWSEARWFQRAIGPPSGDGVFQRIDAIAIRANAAIAAGPSVVRHVLHRLAAPRTGFPHLGRRRRHLNHPCGSEDSTDPVSVSTSQRHPRTALRSRRRHLRRHRTKWHERCDFEGGLGVG